MTSESILERKLELWYEASRADEVRRKAERKHWRWRFFVYLGGLVATVAVATMLANLAS